MKDILNKIIQVQQVFLQNQKSLQEKAEQCMTQPEYNQIYNQLELLNSSVSGGFKTSVDLSFITATQQDILSGKISVDKNGNKITGSYTPSDSANFNINTQLDELNQQFYLINQSNPEYELSNEEFSDINTELDNLIQQINA